MPEAWTHTEYRLLVPGAKPCAPVVLEWPDDPGYDRIAKLVKPIVEGDLEHVYVLDGDTPVSMFVNDIGHLRGLPRNEEATTFYRAHMLKQHPNMPPENLNWIAGPGLIFNRVVWF